MGCFRNKIGSRAEVPPAGSSALVPPASAPASFQKKRDPAGTFGSCSRYFRRYTKKCTTVRSGASTHINSPLPHWKRLLILAQVHPPLEPHQEIQDSLDLLLQPSKALDLWRSEGEDPDLHPHRSDSHFPLICLRAPLLVFLFRETLVVCS